MTTSTFQKVYLDIPTSDMSFFRTLAEKMGWVVKERQTVLESYFDSLPENVSLTEEDILAEVREVRYNK